LVVQAFEFPNLFRAKNKSTPKSIALPVPALPVPSVTETTVREQ
jgi:hypothetical protein